MDFSAMNLPPPPSEAPPKPPRRVSTIMMSPAEFEKPAVEEMKQPMMKRLSRVLSVRRFSKEKKELSGELPSIDLTVGYHLDAFNGKIGVISKLLTRDKYIVNHQFQYSPKGLLSEMEENNKHYIPPPPLPKLVKLTLRKPVEIMTVDQRWLLTHGFADSTLLHYACAGDQLEMVKFLLSNGADWTIVNAANKTAEAYATNDEVRTVMARAEDTYKPLGRPTYTPARAAPEALAAPTMAPPPVPLTPPPASILKPATTGRRRQSIINDSSWADNNLRSSVHQAPVLNIRGSTTQSMMPEPAESSPTISPSGPGGGLKRSLSAKSKPIPVPVSDEEDEAPLATIIPMRFGSTPSTKPNTANTAVTNTSTYSTAASVRTGDDPLGDLQSVASEVTTGTQNTAGSGAITKRMSFRRKSGVLNTLRSRASVGGEAADGPQSNAKAEPAASAPATNSASKETPQTKNNASPQRQPVPTSSKQVEANKAKVSAEQSATEADRSPVRSAKEPKKKTVATKEVSSSEEESSEQRRKTSRSKTKSSKTSTATATATATTKESKDSLAELPKKSASKSKSKGKSENDTVSSASVTASVSASVAASTSTKQSLRRQVPPAPALAPNKEETSGAVEAWSPPAAPAPPIRMMRRLSVNMSMNAVEAVSYTVGAQGETVVSTSVLGADSPEKNLSTSAGEQTGNKQTGSPASTSADAKSLSPRSLAGGSVASSQKSPLGIPRVPTTMELESKGPVDESYLEAWETKLGGSSIAKMQSSLLSGRESMIVDANALIARAKHMEKQEAREAQVMASRAEKMQAMLSKLTPLESIATGMLLRGRTAEEVTQEHERDGEEGADATEGTAEGTAGEQEQKESADKRKGTPQRPGRTADTSPASSPAGADADAALLSKAFHSLTFKEMIWRRAGYYMNAATTDASRSDYDRARSDAYKLGVKLMKQEFQSFATKDRWEAVELVEERRIQEAERRLKELSRAMVSSASAQASNQTTSQLSSLPSYEPFTQSEATPVQSNTPFSRNTAFSSPPPAPHSVTFVDRSNRKDSFVPFS